jgi:hypothetical protein
MSYVEFRSRQIQSRGPGVHPKTDRDHDCDEQERLRKDTFTELWQSVWGPQRHESVSPLSLRSPAARFRSWSEGTDTAGDHHG